MSHTCEKCGNDVIDHSITEAALIRCAKVIAAHTDVNSTAEKLLEILCDFGDAEFSFIYERDYTTNKNELSHVYLSDKSTADFMTFKPVTFDAKNNFSKALAEKDYIFLTYDDAINSDYTVCEEHLKANPNNNILVIPLKINNDVVGIVGVTNLAKHSKDFELSIIIAQFLSSVMSIRYTKDRLSENDRELDDIQDLNETLLKAIDTLSMPNYSDTIDALLDLICNYFNADRAYTFELDEENKTFKNNFERVNGAEESCITNLDEAPYDIAKNWVDTLKDHDIFYKKIYDMDTSNTEYSFLLSENIIDLALVPLKFNDVVIGAIGIDNPKRSGHNYDLLKAVSNLITNSIKRINN